MRRAVLLMLASIVLASCADKPTAGADSARFTSVTGVLASEKSRWVVSPLGVGPVRFGMTLRDLGVALADPAIAGSVMNESCAYLRPKAMPRGIGLMLSHGIVVRADVDSTGILTEAGLGVGDSEVAVLVIHSGRVRVQSSRSSSSQAHTLVVSDPADGGHLLIFESDGSTVRSYRAGLSSAVEFVERCG